MIQPLNKHVLIEPVKHEDFIQTQRDSFEEIGIIMSFDEVLEDVEGIVIGNKVYFDSWLAVKYPKVSTGEFFWLVKYEDIRAYDNGKE